ncbi:trpp-12 [Pristionchus pacificus]|uniref:Trpp-12 n=1 Tax=Pristionchus pacificus TaxID=54126 RepID=A0A2A6D168_PRIPA|nr:trpp-12 [Pristionchus pacificus]|eukprot:PDM84057.1 trpp-12 [Pristionchus pacificus]
MWCRDWESSFYMAHWPPSKRLKSALAERRRGIKYTLPGMKYEFSETRILSEEAASVLKKSVDSVDEDINWNGLKQLMDSREHLAALEATGKILTLLGQGMDKSGRSSTLSPFALEIWSIRFQLLFGLKKYTELLDEMTSFEDLDAPDLFFQYHDDKKEGSMIPFALRMVHAEALVHSPLPMQAVGRVDRLIADVTTLPDFVISSIEKVRDTVDNMDRSELSFLLSRIHLSRSQEDEAIAVLKDASASDEGMRLHQE